jgi:hypothetical protein
MKVKSRDSSRSTCLAARGESTTGRAHRYCGQGQGARRRRCGDIVDDEQRRDCPQYLCAQRVLAAQGHLLRWRSSTMSPHRLRRAALHLPLRRPERGLLYFHHGLLGHHQCSAGDHADQQSFIVDDEIMFEQPVDMRFWQCGTFLRLIESF